RWLAGRIVAGGFDVAFVQALHVVLSASSHLFGKLCVSVFAQKAVGLRDQGGQLGLRLGVLQIRERAPCRPLAGGIAAGADGLAQTYQGVVGLWVYKVFLEIAEETPERFGVRIGVSGLSRQLTEPHGIALAGYALVKVAQFCGLGAGARPMKDI